jgi:single-strand binding protein
MNTWVGIGRLVRDPEVRYTQSRKAVCRFTLAIDDGWGEKKKTYFIPVTCWEKLAEACGNNLVKGQKVAVMGTLTQRTYEQNGEKKNIIEVVAREVDFGAKPRGAEVGATSGGVFAGTPVPDDDIPF